jgi:hypothetical protein
MHRGSQLLSPVRTQPQLRAAILLAGRLGQNPFAAGVRRSVLELPLGNGRTVFDVWAERLAEIAGATDSGSITVQIAVDRDGVPPRIPAAGLRPGVRFEVVQDLAELRGTAGVVRDLTQHLGDSDLVLVGMANQVQFASQANAVADLAASGEGVVLVPHGAGDLASAFVLRRSRLAGIPDIGFVDLKEQAISSAPDDERLRVARLPRGAAMPLRTLEEYIAALRAIHAPAAADGSVHEAPAQFLESWQPRFAVVEDGAEVAAGAVLQDCVVLSGGRVGPRAVVARSVVCPGARVREGQVVVDKLVDA